MLLMKVSRYAYAVIHFFRRLFGKPRFFDYEGRVYEYFEHPYNRTWLNERAVEVPLVWAEAGKHAPQDVLEIGNVLSHYFRFGHTVVDKYEAGHGILQQDAADLDLPQTYPLIISISTIEHVGWDETPRVPGKHRAALDALRRHLAPGGLLMVTFALGYNPGLDDDLRAGALGFEQVQYFKRLTVHDWRQASADEVRGCAYNAPFRAGNGLVIGLFRKPLGG